MTDTALIATPYPWQQEFWQVFNQQLAKEQLSHALLLTGLAGIGKQQLARAMGQRLLCQQPQQALACGACKGCHLFNAETHPDYHFVIPEPGKQIRVEEIRQLQEQLSNTAQQGGRKVVVLGPAESLNTNAANAFLKTLEEPTRNTHIILFCHERSRVLPTISSRCQLIKLSVPDHQLSLDWLQKFAGDRSAELLNAASGLPVRAMELLESDALEERTAIEQHLTKLREGSLGPVNCASQLATYSLETICRLLIDSLEQQVKALVCIERNEQPHWQPKSQNHLLFREKLLDLLSRLRSGFNPNQQLALEELLIDYSRL